MLALFRKRSTRFIASHDHIFGIDGIALAVVGSLLTSLSWLPWPRWYGPAVPNLDLYYEDCVIGGTGSFVITIKEREQFKEATRNKLVQEIAAVPTKPQIVPVQATPRVYCS
jgi:Protein of unknown function (DUF1194)